MPELYDLAVMCDAHNIFADYLSVKVYSGKGQVLIGWDLNKLN